MDYSEQPGAALYTHPLLHHGAKWILEYIHCNLDNKGKTHMENGHGTHRGQEREFSDRDRLTH